MPPPASPRHVGLLGEAAAKSAAAHSGVATQAPQHVATSATVPTAMSVPESAEAAKSVQLEFGCGFAAGA